MHRIDTPGAQQDKFGAGKNGFTDGDPATGRAATRLNADYRDAIQEELACVAEAAGLILNKREHNQLYEAIKRLIDRQALLPGNHLAELEDKAAALATLAAVPESRNVNGHTLNADIRLSATDVKALPLEGTALAAMKLAIARKINGVAFDGSADITLPPPDLTAYATKPEAQSRADTAEKNAKNWAQHHCVTAVRLGGQVTTGTCHGHPGHLLMGLKTGSTSTTTGGGKNNQTRTHHHPAQGYYRPLQYLIYGQWHSVPAL